MEYLDYTQEDASNDGIGYTISHYSKKVVKNNKTIGAIIFQILNCRKFLGQQLYHCQKKTTNTFNISSL